MPNGYFVTGTDTEIGKTFCSVALINRLIGTGQRVAGFKPVSAGCELSEHGLRNQDALDLMAAANVELPYEIVNPYAFAPPISPHIAAARAGERIDIPHCVQLIRDNSAACDSYIVEGVGGWLAPLTNHETVRDLAIALELPVILVVGMRLGCLSHAQLTHDAILASGLPIAGWIANGIDPDMNAQRDNIETLSIRLGCRRLATLPYSPGTNRLAEAAKLAAHLRTPAEPYQREQPR